MICLMPVPLPFSKAGNTFKSHRHLFLLNLGTARLKQHYNMEHSLRQATGTAWTHVRNRIPAATMHMILAHERSLHAHPRHVSTHRVFARKASKPIAKHSSVFANGGSVGCSWRDRSSATIFTSSVEDLSPQQQ